MWGSRQLFRTSLLMKECIWRFAPAFEAFPSSLLAAGHSVSRIDINQQSANR